MSLIKTKFTKPIIKWIGGKTQILEQILDKFPNIINNYHEIFLGGGSILLGFLEKVKKGEIKVNKIYAYDYNKNLINLYNLIKTDYKRLYNDIMKLVNIYNLCNELKGNKKPKTIEEAHQSKESYYYWLRNEYNKTKDDIYYKSALFVFLNKTCFRGMYRIGPNGFNVPFGHYKNPTIINKDSLEKISVLIQNVNFICMDFNDSIKNIKKDDFSYLDPPYYPINNKSFVKYNKNGFNLDNHNKLFKLCEILNENKIKFIMSNSYTKFITDIFSKKPYNLCEINVKRRINSKKPQSKCKEVIISNFM
tara:strand:- start:937 stop:1854 length:918 start_codon:yes stop_codon:yes gene_type:complete